jgi:hypothetical protein
MAANLELVDAARAKNVKISEIGLVGDIRATNARFALALPDGSVTPTRSYVSHDFSSLGEAVEKYLGDEAPPERPSQAALAVAYSPDLAQWKWEVLWRPGYIPRLSRRNVCRLQLFHRAQIKMGVFLLQILSKNLASAS